MTLMLKNVDSNTLRVIESLQGLNKKLQIEMQDESPKSELEFKEVRQILKERLQKPENYAVFERLKDK